MRLLKRAKLRQCLSLFAMAPVLIPTDLPCGIYHASGTLSLNAKGNYVLTMNGDTLSPFEILLLGGNGEAKQRRLGTRAYVEAYLPQAAGKNGPAPFFLQRFRDGSFKGVDSLELKSHQKCKDPKRYVKG